MNIMNIESLWNEFGLNLELILIEFGIYLKFLVAQQLYISIRYFFYFFFLFVKLRTKLRKQKLTKPKQPNQAKNDQT